MSMYAPCRMGLSPRGRGSRLAASPCAEPRGSIPAWAGEPRSSRRQWDMRRVYPRVGGGAYPPPPSWRECPGLSPRGRGSLRDGLYRRVLDGSIPAWAGEPQGSREWPVFQKVYPRVGGGAVRRTHSQISSTGLSPRGRGSPDATPRTGRHRGSIPAWAGEPSISKPRPTAGRVYPRVGGGAASRRGHDDAGRGLSPRGRGSRDATLHAIRRAGSIPAWAGEPHPI